MNATRPGVRSNSPRLGYWAAAFCAAVIVVLAPTMAMAQGTADIRSLNERLDMLQRDFRQMLDLNGRLQRDMRDLQNEAVRSGNAPRPATGPTGAGGPAPSSGMVADLDSRLSSFDEQVRSLTGKMEEMSFNIAQVRSRLDKLVGDVDFRLTALEKGAPAAPSADNSSNSNPGQTLPQQPPSAQARAGTQQAALPPEPVLPSGQPQEQYDYAYGLLTKAQRDQVEMGKAEQALAAFVAAHPDHRLAGNAQYWLGETYYVRNDYVQAARSFGEGFKKYPKSDKAPDLLLKLGMALSALGQKQQACAAFAQVDREIPTAPQQIKQQVLAQKQRTGC